MGALKNFINGITDGESYDDDDFLDGDDVMDEDEKPARGRDNSGSRNSGSRNSGSRRSSSGMEVVVIKPTTVEEAREITDTLLANKIVNLNLEGLDVAVAQRIIDFISGSTYALSGNLEKISQYIFLITPRTVAVSGDYRTSGDIPGFSGNPSGRMM